MTPDPVTVIAAAQTAVAAGKNAKAILKQINEISEHLKPFKPEVNSFRIDYFQKNSEAKYLLFIPDGIRRIVKRKIEIPAIVGFRFDEMWDLDRMAPVTSSWTLQDNKWILDIDSLPSSERYWLTMKGRISNEFLEQLVSVKAAENPCREEKVDKYWIHSALKDVSILQNIWRELNIEQVNAEVRIGVERFFTSTVPKSVQEKFKLQDQLLEAIRTGNRDVEIRLKQRYRQTQKHPVVSPSELYELFLKLASGEFFAPYLQVGDPYIMNNIEPVKKITSLIPEKVKVGVQTNLNYQMPAANGNLCFERQRYLDEISKKVKELIPSKKA